jgi:hypothetical protein
MCDMFVSTLTLCMNKAGNAPETIGPASLFQIFSPAACQMFFDEALNMVRGLLAPSQTR